MTSAVNSGVWIRRYRPAPEAAVRLVCLPHAGGSASYYLPMAQALAPGADVLAAQYPGRQDRYAEPPSESVRELAERIVEAVGGDDRPLALFGHSMGAVVAYEMALQLEAAGRAPVRLFVSGRRAPSALRDGRRLRRASDTELIEAVRRARRHRRPGLRRRGAAAARPAGAARRLQGPGDATSRAPATGWAARSPSSPATPTR